MRHKNSSNDQRGIRCRYLDANIYMNIAWERLIRDGGLLAPSYRALLERQIRECQHELEKKVKADFLP
jgi:hypothetical protein